MSIWAERTAIQVGMVVRKISSVARMTAAVYCRGLGCCRGLGSVVEATLAKRTATGPSRGHARCTQMRAVSRHNVGRWSDGFVE